MSFWKTSGYTYRSFTDLPEDKIVLLINAFSREDIIEWLSWNDHNGIYTDEQSLKEFGNVMSLEEGIEIIFRQIEENRSPAQ
ncbi:hypothetical protein [Daejeonella sp.]|uniref:hypothetical protein n=1 Tax=Daejeonella sp. TaxID=2805397 RepID=UPI0027319E91|nr:hypothetical protein [Daejeonella sp.]MDP2414289.1 hypothetical protein [Daejeonella sp.]